MEQDAYEIFEMGLQANEKHNFGEAFQYFQQAASMGLPDAQYMLGLAYALGHGVKPDLRIAVVWMNKAAEKGDLDAQLWLGENCVFGNGNDKSRGVALIKKLAKAGFESAFFAMGYCYLFGIENVPQDVKQAKKWLKKAAESGDDRVEEFLENLEELESRVKNNPTVRFWKMWNDVENGDYDEYDDDYDDEDDWYDEDDWDDEEDEEEILDEVKSEIRFTRFQKKYEKKWRRLLEIPTSGVDKDVLDLHRHFIQHYKAFEEYFEDSVQFSREIIPAYNQYKRSENMLDGMGTFAGLLWMGFQKGMQKRFGIPDERQELLRLQPRLEEMKRIRRELDNNEKVLMSLRKKLRRELQNRYGKDVID